MPLSLDVWIYMTTAYLGVSITMFLLARLTPFEWENPQPGVDEPEELENELTLHNCFWHNWGSLMQQGSDIAPKYGANFVKLSLSNNLIMPEQSRLEWWRECGGSSP